MLTRTDAVNYAIETTRTFMGAAACTVSILDVIGPYDIGDGTLACDVEIRAAAMYEDGSKDRLSGTWSIWRLPDGRLYGEI